MEDIHKYMSHLAWLDHVEKELRFLHDKICGENVYLTATGHPLGELGADIRLDIFEKLGRSIHAALTELPEDGQLILTRGR